MSESLDARVRTHLEDNAGTLEDAAVAALYAVLDIHASVATDSGSPSGLAAWWCRTCQRPDDTQCPTVHAIAAALGVGTDRDEGDR